MPQERRRCPLPRTGTDIIEVLYLGEDKQADELAKKYGILASPGIIINGTAVNPYQLVEHCKVKDAEGTKKLFLGLLEEAEAATAETA